MASVCARSIGNWPPIEAEIENRIKADLELVRRFAILLSIQAPLA